VTFGKQLSHVLPPLPEIKIRKDALANRLAAFKHRLAHAAGQIGTILFFAREPVRVDDESVFSRIAVAGKNFPEKLLTFSHNSQNRHRPDTQIAFPGTKAHWSPAKQKASNEKHGCNGRSSTPSPERRIYPAATRAGCTPAG
jgi:hypothetical protein